MEKQAGFVPKLTLEEMALRKSVVHFWSEIDILSLIEKFPFKTMPGKWKLWQETVEYKVKDKISKLVFPESLKRRMNLLVTPIGLQIPEWVNFMAQFLSDSREDLDIQLLKQLCWTSAGALDYKKTAESLVRLRTLDVVKRFKIACEHCLVDSLPVVWEELPDEYKSGFLKINLNNIWGIDKLMQLYWVYALKGEEYKLLERYASFHNCAFLSSAYRGNKVATEYFFEKITNEERRSFFSSNFHCVLEGFLGFPSPFDFPKEECTDVLFYLLSQMHHGEQMQVLRDYPGYIFRIFLHWPWQDLFLDKTALIWNFLPEGSTYNDLLRHITFKIKFSEYYFPELFQEFFGRSPVDFRKYFLNQECLGNTTLFCTFLYNEDEETVRAILRNIDVEDRVRLVSCLKVFYCLDSVLGRKGQDVVELCVREACPSKEDRERVKEVYMRYLKENEPSGVFCRRKWQRFFESLDEADASCLNKRISEDETVTRAKRL
ncbi:hypothetical protein AVEN_26823-1 [Araneus ventricosus]|uniref:HTH araC/xylS-type domain-containing protein n=1 Tax=Araneus ventricosus TaxID=182803 RepID=A0A4Y2TMH1_ARAVE|nr:hypothetical protein AVEN_26823-1 [Araneus ventricosus]